MDFTPKKKQKTKLIQYKNEYSLQHLLLTHLLRMKFNFLKGDLHIVEGTKAALDRERVWFAAAEDQLMTV